MKRSKRHRVKQEHPETSTSRPVSQKEHDLAYYIHDRVELMHQVFSVLKSKEIKAMAPECVRHISVSDLQELCMEELLGISSKRLCAILDGATPPSDTESSSESEQLETISLDSISSDEEILSQVSSKKSKKHKHRSKSKPKKRKSKDNNDDKDQADRSRRAGLTVLELLELQARARAIRAQLQQEQATAVSTGQPSESVTGNSDDEVEIKEEAAEVVEISSEDEKPNVQMLEERITASNKETAQDASNSNTITKKVNNLIITVPKANSSRKIKLKRNTSSNYKPAEKAPENENSSKTNSTVIVVEETDTTNRQQGSKNTNQSSSKSTDAVETQNSQSKTDKSTKNLVNIKDKSKSKDKKKKRKRGKENDKYGSDHDEITLQLSDTEKMDLLEDLDEKKPEKGSGTEDSSSDSSDEDSATGDSDEGKNSESIEKDIRNTDLDKDKVVKESSIEIVHNNESVSTEKSFSDDTASKEIENKTSDTNSLSNRVDEQDTEKDKGLGTEKGDETTQCDIDESNKAILDDKNTETQPIDSVENENVISENNATEISSSHDKPIGSSDFDEQNIQDAEMQQDQKQSEEKSSEINIESNSEIIKEDTNVSDKVLAPNSELTTIDTVSKNEADNADKDNLKEKSEGELSDRDSSEVEASDFQPDVVCISDDEEKKGKKKKKKDKKSKKEKKSKKKKDFRESADQNFYSEVSKNVPNELNTSENEVLVISDMVENDESNSKCDSSAVKNIEIFQEKELKDMENLKSEVINTDSDVDDDVYEILELSGDSSCYEVEEISISIEPTTEEIEALSARVDELERDTVIHNTIPDKESEESDTLSWKERYLKSNKVKKVLTTANILNAMRKKNLELKKKLQESKKEVEIEEKSEVVEEAPPNVEDGSIEQYNTLEASTKYVDPVKEANESTDNTEENGSTDKTAEEKNGTKDKVTNEMKKEAKQLLKMYKMLLKYNDMTLPKDPNKKKKKKKKSKAKEKSAENTSTG